MSVNLIDHKVSATFRMTLRLPFDLTGATLSSTLRGSEYSQPLSIRVLDAANGVLELEQSATETSVWPIEILEYDVKGVYSSGDVFATQNFYIQPLENIT